jgi:hypothetical protein
MIMMTMYSKTMNRDPGSLRVRGCFFRAAMATKDVNPTRKD